MIAAEIPPSQLLLDPNNYRFAEHNGFVVVPEPRFSEEVVQRRANERLRAEGILDLKRSIQKNGFLPIERIVVREYPASPGQFVVIEGNRRVTAAKWILEDHLAGADFSQSVLTSVGNLPCIVLQAEEDNEVLRTSLMGIRHVSGIREWGGYQRAKLVLKMRDDLSLDLGEIADRLGMTAHEVNRRYRAIKALEQMVADEEFGDYAAPVLYPIFHETVSLPVVREWLGWDSSTNMFTNTANLDSFYSLLIPSIDDETGQELQPKISNRESIRDLKIVLGNAEAREALFQPSATFASSLLIAQRTHLASSWVRQIEEAISALESLGVDAVRGMTSAQKSALESLRSLASQRLADHLALAPAS